MQGEGSEGSWFLAKNSGKNFRMKEPSCWVAMSLIRPLRLQTSLALLPEARAMRNTVLQVRDLRSDENKGSYGASRREARTKKRSQAGSLLGALASLLEAPLITSLKRELSENVREPNWRRVVETAALYTLREEADKPQSWERWAKKLPRSNSDGLEGEMPCLLQNESQRFQCEE